ncbi:MaoC/PaaZ C-terminal domain-containing protein [Geodermatophilus sp. SYSU D00815]
MTEHRWLRAGRPLRDGHLADVPEEAGAAAVAAVVGDVRPDLVLTFGPDGLTGHPDHRAVSAWTTRAVAGTGARLWWAALTAGWLDRWGPLCAATGVWMTGPPAPAADPEHVAVLSGRLLDRKLAALRAHRSQTAGLIARVGEEVYREWWRTARDIELSTGLAGDRDPVHHDPELATRSRFGGIVVQGGVTSGLLDALVAEDLPGPGSVLLAVHRSFRAAVRPGEVLTATAEVTGARADEPVCTPATTIANQDGLVVLDGTAVVRRDPVVAAAAQAG